MSGGDWVFTSPYAALARPRRIVRWLVRFRDRLGLPEPDQHWQTTAQVRWHGGNPPSLVVRTWCLYAGHDLRSVKVRDQLFNSHRLICARCQWEGPWL